MKFWRTSPTWSARTFAPRWRLRPTGNVGSRATKRRDCWESSRGVDAALFDENLAPSLAHRLSDLYTRPTHVRDLGMATADDEQIWLHARDAGYLIVTEDDDFRQRSF